MTHPYDWASVHQVAFATHTDWYAGTLAALLNVGPYAKEGDRGYVEECLAWVTRRTIYLTDEQDLEWQEYIGACRAMQEPVGTLCLSALRDFAERNPEAASLAKQAMARRKEKKNADFI